MRHDGRAADQLRPISIQRGYLEHPAGSVLIVAGRTRVLCNASIGVGVPPWREASGHGWLTAEYEMLPAATNTRRPRDRTKVDGRTQEIQRLIGRALRAAVDLRTLGLHTLTIDCDVLQADGGTRTAAITGAYVALCDAIRAGRERGLWSVAEPLTQVAAVSVGISNDVPVLDLDYYEDARAAVDCNLVMTGRGEWIEVQATGENASFTDQQFEAMKALGRRGIEQLFAMQVAALA